MVRGQPNPTFAHTMLNFELPRIRRDTGTEVRREPSGAASGITIVDESHPGGADAATRLKNFGHRIFSLSWELFGSSSVVSDVVTRQRSFEGEYFRHAISLSS